VVLSGIERILPKPIKINDSVIHLIIDQISDFQQLIPVLQKFSSLRKVTLEKWIQNQLFSFYY